MKVKMGEIKRETEKGQTEAIEGSLRGELIKGRAKAEGH